MGDRPTAGLRPFDARDQHRSGGDNGQDRPRVVPPHRSSDVRYHRPAASAVRPAPHAHHRVPARYTYRPWYTRWYSHPWYRYQYSTLAVVSFGFAVHPWVDYWVPPARAGFYWVPGQVVYGAWYPGYWAPVAAGPAGYVYVNGWWENEAYVDGYWRVDGRDGWIWVDGYYLDDGTYGRAHWRPDTSAPDGYSWEAGFWDGEDWVDGFWRPEYRDGFLWVGAYYDSDGVFHGGYWSPLDDRPGQVWIPGWFDGNEWVEGYWVDGSEVTEGALNDWTPPEGVDDGWRDQEPFSGSSEDGRPPEARLIDDYRKAHGEAPLAVPVVVPD